MTQHPSPADGQPPDAAADPLVRELGALPRFAAPLAAGRAAYVRAFAPRRWYEPALTTATRVSLPVALGTIVVVYLSWALSAASALMH